MTDDQCGQCGSWWPACQGECCAAGLPTNITDAVGHLIGMRTPKASPAAPKASLDASWTDGSFMRTRSGQHVNLRNPDPKTIVLEDIAYALSRIVRFNGHTRTAVPLNVAQHSVMVMRMAMTLDGYTPELAMAALMHDAHEAYTGDISTPMARALYAQYLPYDPHDPTPLAKIKANVQAAICESLDLWPVWPGDHRDLVIKKADSLLLQAELKQFMREDKGVAWPAEKAEQVFLRSYRLLKTATT